MSETIELKVEENQPSNRVNTNLLMDQFLKRNNSKVPPIEKRKRKIDETLPKCPACDKHVRHTRQHKLTKYHLLNCEALELMEGKSEAEVLVMIVDYKLRCVSEFRNLVDPAKIFKLKKLTEFRDVYRIYGRLRDGVDTDSPSS